MPWGFCPKEVWKCVCVCAPIHKAVCANPLRSSVYSCPKLKASQTFFSARAGADILRPTGLGGGLLVPNDQNSLSILWRVTEAVLVTFHCCDKTPEETSLKGADLCCVRSCGVAELRGGRNMWQTGRVHLTASGKLREEGKEEGGS